MNWYTLTTFPRREFEAADSLTRRGYHPYVPMRREWSHRSRYSKSRELLPKPLIAGYVFLPAETEPGWFRVLNARWVRGVLCVDSVPTKVRRGEMEKLKDRENGGEFTAWDGQKHMRPGVLFNTGDIVRAVTGPFTGNGGTVDSINTETGTAFVSMEILGGHNSVQIGLDALEVV